ncbi:MAG: cation diffusion facilitator family transporter [Clostridia bacterium]
MITKLIHNSQDVKNPKVRESYGKVAGIIGIISNIILFVFKFAVGTIFSSVSIVADAVNNLFDCISSIITIIGFKLSSKPADEKHPFGHARMEYLAGVFISFIIVIIGFQLAETSIEKIIKPVVPQFGLIVFIVLIFSVFVKVWQWLFYKNIAKKINSKTLLATSIDSRNDVFSTTAVLIATLITKFSGINLDAFMGLSVSILIIYSGVKMVVDTSNPLLGERAEKELREEISKNVTAYDGVLGIHDLVVHNYGAGKCYASVHCEICASASVMDSHDLVDGIERDFKNEHSINLVIHMDPIVTDDEKTNNLREKVKTIINAVYPEISVHDFRVVWSNVKSNIVFDINVPFSLVKSDKEITSTIEKLIQTIEGDFSVIITVDRV